MLSEDYARVIIDRSLAAAGSAILDYKRNYPGPAKAIALARRPTVNAVAITC
jgi:hypothetical protein